MRAKSLQMCGSGFEKEVPSSAKMEEINIDEASNAAARGAKRLFIPGVGDLPVRGICGVL